MIPADGVGREVLPVWANLLKVVQVGSLFRLYVGGSSCLGGSGIVYSKDRIP
jgi:hypothetical protein